MKMEDSEEEKKKKSQLEMIPDPKKANTSNKVNPGP